MVGPSVKRDAVAHLRTGVRIEPGEIETVLAETPGVFATVDLHKGSNAERHLVAYLLPADPNRMRSETVWSVAGVDPTGVPARYPEHSPLDTPSHVRTEDDAVGLVALGSERARRLLPGATRPDIYAVVRSLPLTSNGKTDRPALPPPPILNGCIEGEPALHRISIERRLFELWTSASGRQAMGRSTSLLDGGLRSIAIVRLVSRMRAEFSISFEMRACRFPARSEPGFPLRTDPA